MELLAVSTHFSIRNLSVGLHLEIKTGLVLVLHIDSHI